jgi:hypothetical protein
MSRILLLFIFFIATVAQGQVTVKMTLYKSGDIAYIDIAKFSNNAINVTFSQRDITEKNRKEILELLESKKITLDSAMSRMKEKQFISLKETSRFKYDDNALLFHLLDTLLENRDSLSRLTDKRLILDGMSCSLDISYADTIYKLNYRVPQSKSNTIIHLFIKQILTDLKTSGRKKKIQDYCAGILQDYFRKEGGAYVNFGNL